MTPRQILGEGTRAVRADMLHDGDTDRRPLCPACHHGFLHPYTISCPLGGVDFQDVGMAWVAICVGNKAGERGRDQANPPCGFNVPLTAYRFVPHVGLVREGDKT